MNTIVEQLEMLSTAEQVAVLNAYYEDVQYYDDKIYDFDEHMIEGFFHFKWEALRATMFGDVNMSDDYFRLDGYGNLQTLSDTQIENELVRDADIITWLEENPEDAENLGIEIENDEEE